MSTYYDVFAELKTKDGWKNLNFYMPDKDGKLQLVPIISGQSLLGMTIDFHGESWPAKNISEELAAAWNPEHFNWYHLEIPALKDGNLDKPEFAGFIPKYYAYDFESGTISEIPEEVVLSPEEFKDLDPLSKEGYVHYEWTLTYGSRSILKKILAGINARIDAYNNIFYLEDISFSDIRLVYVIS